MCQTTSSAYTVHYIFCFKYLHLVYTDVWFLPAHKVSTKNLFDPEHFRFVAGLH